MAGLLDFEDPQQAGLLALAHGLFQAGSPQPVRTGLGQALTGSLMNMQQAQMQAEMLRRKKAQEDLQMQMHTLQADEFKRKAALDAAIRNEYKNSYSPQGLDLASLPNKLMGIGAYDEGLALQKQLRGENYKLGKDESLFSPDNKLIASGIQSTPKNELKEGYITQDANGKWAIDPVLYAAHVKAKQAGATSVNVGKDNLGLRPADRFNMEGKLSDDYRGETKTDQGVLSAVSKIKTSLSKPGALADQSAIYSFAKMLDPEGAVRESDYAAVMNTAGLEDRVRNYIQKMQTGEMLSPNQRKEMLDVMSRFEQVASSKISNVRKNYSERATSYNLDPQKLFMDAKKETAPVQQKTVVRTGTYNGRKVVEYSDGSVGYGN